MEELWRGPAGWCAGQLESSYQLSEQGNEESEENLGIKHTWGLGA